jgi:hypothetical protein
MYFLRSLLIDAELVQRMWRVVAVSINTDQR